ncbi:D-beta-hydroxybutyrate dehydrogenase, mitochondrial-like [Ptychodera flava]|uniref:D-beta-hydroxybutyrate dehydrogenase, mitochondrial-like n=1 Tax=Ptychodera flava TaxID=63121 RepID=UPI00396A7788
MTEVTKVPFAIVLACLLPLFVHFSWSMLDDARQASAIALVLTSVASYIVVRLSPSWNLAGYSVVIPVKKAVLITGCDSGFGHALVKKLDAYMFSTVFAACLNPDGDGAKKLTAECSKRVVVLPLDVSSDESVASAMKIIDETLIKRNHDLWAVVNNAGIWTCADIEFAPVERFKKLAEVNVYGTVRVTKACLKHIRRNKGRVVNVTSISGLWTIPSNAEYCMTKYALECFSDTLRHEMHQWGVKVSIVEPGPYAKATKIGLNLWEEFERSSNALWDNVDDSIKRQYGKAYFDSHIDWWKSALADTYDDGTPVVDAMVHAVWSINPKHRYLIGGFFNTKLTAFIMNVLPSYLTDKIFFRQLSHYVKPACLRKSL